MSDTFNDPGSGGDVLPINDLVGSLLLFTVHGESDPIETKFGTQVAMRTDVAVLDGPQKGEVFADTLIFQRVLKAQLHGSIGGKVLGRLELGPNKKGNPPFQLAAATDSEKETGRKYLAYLASQEPVVVPEAPEEPF